MKKATSFGSRFIGKSLSSFVKEIPVYLVNTVFIIVMPISKKSFGRWLLCMVGLAASILVGALSQSCRGCVSEGGRADSIPCDSSAVSGLRSADTLRVATLSSSTTYFVYKDEEMGYEYELAKLLADSLGLTLVVEVVPNDEALYAAVDTGLVDMAITPQAATFKGKQKYLFVGPEEISGQVLVQRSDGNPRITNVTDLIGKPVTVMAHTRYADRLRHLNEEVGGGIDSLILSGDTLTTEDLITQVAKGEIDYTFADEQLARLARTYYRNIDISLKVGFGQRLQWIVRKDNHCLARWVNRWGESIPDKESYRAIQKRYFEMSKSDDEVEEEQSAPRPRIKLRKGSISQYDTIFKHYAEEFQLGWSWHLLASIAYHESRFNAGIVGWSGARGLMGIMPRTGRRFGADKQELLDPEVSVRVSIRCLLAFKNEFPDVTDPEEKLKFTLAAYNAGSGRVADARRLAAKYGGNPNVWDNNVEAYIRLKKDPNYYNDPVCRSGYLRGAETINYVRSVMARYQAYKQKD